MPAETVAEKGKRFVDQQRVKPLPSGSFQVYGDSDRYTVTVRRNGELRCSCPVRAKQECSHRVAVRLWQDADRKKQARLTMYRRRLTSSKVMRRQKQADRDEHKETTQMGQFVIQKAVKAKKKARIALDGPAGSGKTYTALELAEGLADGGKIGLLDTEKSSADLYADRYNFDTIKLNNFNPNNYIGAIEAFAEAGYEVLIIDSWSHAWDGEGGALEMVDEAAKRSRSGNSFTAWREVTPRHNEMVAAILDFPGHVIVTMRTKMEYVLEQDEKGKTTPKKVGMAPIQRGGVEYEFDVIVDMDLDHNFIVSKTRLSCLDGKVIKNPTRKVGKGILDDLNSGAVATAPLSTPTHAPATPKPQEEEAQPPAAPVASAPADDVDDATFRMSEKREAAVRGALANLRFDAGEVDEAIAWADSQERSDDLVAWVKASSQRGLPKGRPPWFAEVAETGAESAGNGEAPLGAGDAAQAATEGPDPFGEGTSTEGSAGRLTDSDLTPSASDAPAAAPATEEPVYDQNGQPANAAAVAHSQGPDLDENAVGIATCKEMTDAFTAGEAEAVEEKYHEILSAPDGAALIAYLGPRCHKLKAAERHDLLDRCGLGGKSFDQLTVAERLYVAMAAEG